jgi:hypothetical protein
MTESENTLVCTFDLQSLRITAYDINELIHETIHLEGTDMAMVQVDGPRRQVYMNFKEYRRMQETLMSTNGQGGIAPFERGHLKSEDRSSQPGNKASEDRKSPTRNFRQSDQDGPEQIRGDQRDTRRNMVTRLSLPSV